MKKYLSYVYLFLVLFVLSSCGMTEELDQLQSIFDETNTILNDQKANYSKFLSLVNSLEPVFEKEVALGEDTTFQEEEGPLYENYQERLTLLETMEKNNDKLNKNREELIRIEKKKAVDVPNERVADLADSIEITEKNFEAFKLYSETGMKQEEKLYNQFPLEDETDKENKYSLIQLTYGSLNIIAEEAPANIAYTLYTTKDIQNQIEKSAKK